MPEEVNLLLPLKEISAKKSIFHILRPNKKTWILSVLIFLTSYVLWFLIIRFIDYPDFDPRPVDYRFQAILIASMSIISPVISIFLWKWVSRKIVKNLVFKSIKIQNEQKDDIKELFRGLKKEEHYRKFSFFRILISSFFGLNLDVDTKYYLEEETEDLDISKLKHFFRKRLYDMTTSSLGIGFLLASIVKYSIRSTYIGFIAGSIVILVSPVLISWLTPVVWIMKDSKIRYINPNREQYDIYEKFRRSSLSRFFSISAWLAGLGFFIDLIQLITKEYDPALRISILMYLAAFAAVIVVAILMSGTLFIVGMAYLSFYHAKNVNELRDELSEFIKFSQTNAIISQYYFM